MQKYLSLLPFIMLVVLAAASGAQFMPGAWYASIIKPAWTPPDWLFPIAWTVLYLMIAIAGWLAWQAGGVGPAVVIWGVGLVLNALWSYFMVVFHVWSPGYRTSTGRCRGAVAYVSCIYLGDVGA